MSPTAMFALTAASAVTQIAGGYAAKEQADINARLYEQQGAFYTQRGDLNALLYEDQAKFLDQLSDLQGERIDIQKDIDLTQQRRLKNQVASAVMVRTAYSGLEFAGSPVAVMVDNLTQAGIDEEITKYNYTMEKITSEYGFAQEKIAARTKASESRIEGRLAASNLQMRASNLRFQGVTARNTAFSNAFSTLLKGGYTYGRQKGYIKVAGTGGVGEL